MLVVIGMIVCFLPLLVNVPDVCYSLKDPMFFSPE